jgi:hypothetical protein
MFVGRRGSLTLSLILVVSLLSSPAVSAQTATGDWSALKAVASGSRLSVKLKTGKTVKGRLTGVSDDALSLSVGGRPTQLKAVDVLRVYSVGGSSAKTGALVGAAVGGGAGAAVGASGEEGFGPSKGQMAAGLAVLAGGVGALAGYAIGRSRHKRVLVYQAAERP